MISEDIHSTSALQRRTPMMTPLWKQMLERLTEHPAAPRFNHAAGDRLQAQDVQALRQYRASLDHTRTARLPAEVPEALLERVERWRTQVPLFIETIPVGMDLRLHWSALPTTSREDVARHPERLMPLETSLEPLIVYRTAGTSGHALIVPHEARAAATYQPLIEAALARYNVHLEPGPDTVACFLVGAQARTVTYPCNLSYWDGAGFAKINLTHGDWRDAEAPQQYFDAFQPQFLTGDPITFAEMLRTGLRANPRAMISTAVAMSAGLRRKLQEHYRCPVIEWYSLTETGPIGYACPAGSGYHQLPADLYLEALDPQGQPVPPGERGEITVTGGRNPFLPLLRYRTGDWGRLDHTPCACGDPMPRLLELEGRAPVLFRSATGALINPVDISRILREFPLVQHTLHQDSQHRVTLSYRPVASGEVIAPQVLQKALEPLFGAAIPLQVTLNPTLGDRDSEAKVIPYQSELLLED